VSKIFLDCAWVDPFHDPVACEGVAEGVKVCTGHACRLINLYKPFVIDIGMMYWLIMFIVKDKPSQVISMPVLWYNPF
jgi:hypothetical protein